MGLAFGRRRPERASLAEAVPKRQPQVREEATTEGTLVLINPQARSGSLLMWRARRSRFELDEIGQYVWELCDGGRDARGIAKLLQSRFRMHRVEAEAALGSFLQSLSQRGLITLTSKPEKKRK